MMAAPISPVKAGLGCQSTARLQWEFGIKSTQLWDMAWPGDSTALVFSLQGAAGKLCSAFPDSRQWGRADPLKFWNGRNPTSNPISSLLGDSKAVADFWCAQQ